LNQSGRGERLFGNDGKPTPYVENMLKFLQQYQLEFRRTQAFCKKLKDLNLLEPMRAQIELGSGQRMALRGFSVVQRARLKTLAANVLAELVRSDELELIYTHVVSMRNFATLRDRLAQAQPAHSVGGGPVTH
jgi:SapC